MIDYIWKTPGNSNFVGKMAESENSRFASVAETNIEELLENAVPVAMTKATKFGMNLFDGKLTFNFIFNIKFTKQSKTIHLQASRKLLTQPKIKISKQK